MATPNPPNDQTIPPAQKARTIAHMNTDHRTDLRHILQHYGAVPPIPPSYYSTTTDGKDDEAAQKNPLMTDIDLHSLTLQLPGRDGLHRVVFEPPLGGWGERRGRLVEMTRVAREALGVVVSGEEGGHGEGKGDVNGVVVDEYMAPRVPYDLAIFVAVLGYYLCYALVWRGWFAEGSVAARVVEGVRFPGGVGGFTWLVEAIFVPVVALHVFETWLLERTKLQKFGVRRGSAVWWMWVVEPVLEMGYKHQPSTFTFHAAQDWPSNIKDVLLSNAPKRWVVYEPMVLLPSGSFITQPWPTLLSSLSPSQKEPLWTAILRHISPANKPPLTHLAINEGIPLHLGSGSSPTDGDNPNGQQEEPQKKDGDDEENVLRSPTHLHPLHGDFGPPPSSTPTRPSQADFDAALWVTTKQNGLVQVWAPAHTMFSRGNVKEKARLLSFHDDDARTPNPNPAPNPTTPQATPTPSPNPPLTSTPLTSQPPPPTTTKTNRTNPPTLHNKHNHALDLYAGIGYFAFPLARLGLRVLCWELNAWSVEGLRRGAAANGFSVRVISSESSGFGGGVEGGDGSGNGDCGVSGG
ncbi:hypothetical protein F5144DRAFT_616378 [Chaetomium tenue]|uniref:Uncharacterized protein n=1 Tax=Chaetomium tenue TaxID=1854479 RepID=A0ACB7NZ15_9PEZI|nr:hypothetical protein F5144DRAFT_616378 [Chaetomium globosum]